MSGCTSAHTLLQQRISPPTDQFVARFGHRYGHGDKVIHIVKDRERDIYNDGLSVAIRIDHAQTELTTMFGQTEAIFDFGELNALQLAYATTIHKSEESSTQCVVLPLMMQAYTGTPPVAHRATRGDSTKRPIGYVAPVVGVLALGYGAFVLFQRARRS